MLDDESDEESQEYLLNHLGVCTCCLKEFELEKQVRELLKTKLEKRPVPDGLANSIKAKILQSPNHVR